jgi:RNA recognition motif-containing protein
MRNMPASTPDIMGATAALSKVSLDGASAEQLKTPRAAPSAAAAAPPQVPVSGPGLVDNNFALRQLLFHVNPFLAEMMKRTSSQSYDASPAVLAAPGGAGNGSLDPLGQAALPSSLADGINKKARFVSEGHVPAFNYPTSAPASQTFGDLSPGVQHANLYSQQQQQQQGGNRSISLGMMGLSTGGQTPGAPAPSSPFVQHAYAPAPLNLASNNALMGGLNGGAFSPLSAGPQSVSYLMPGMPGHEQQQQQQAQLQSPMSAMSAMYANFSPGAFGASPGLGQFVPNMGMMSAPPQGNQTGRTVYVGNLPADASVDELLNQVKFGPIENVRILAEKNCAFISFLDGGTAAAFHADASVKKMSLHNQELKIGWGKPSTCPTPVAMAVQQSQATRNVYLGQLDESVTEQSLRDDLSRFGPIDQVKIVRDKNIGFVHFLSITTAMKVVATLPTEPAWTGKRVNYGKDRCAYVPRSQQQNQQHNNQAAAMGMAAAASLGYPTAFSATSVGFPGMPNAAFGALSPASAPPGMGFGLGMPSSGNAEEQARSASSGSAFGVAAAAMLGGGANAAPNSTALSQIGNRTVYLGNIHPETTTEEICNHVRGGILQNVRYIAEKHIAFLTFVDANTALAFFHLASYSGVMIHNRRLKIGWGKHSGPLSPAIAMAVQAGGSRNVYVGNIENADVLNDEKLRRDFGEYGEIELVNSLREKNCVSEKMLRACARKADTARSRRLSTSATSKTPSRPSRR